MEKENINVIINSPYFQAESAELVARKTEGVVVTLATSVGAFDSIKNYFDLVEKTRKTPRDILASFEEYLIDDYSKKTPKEIEDWAAKQAYLIMGNLLTVCAVEQIDSCPIEGFVPEQYDEFLGITEMGLRSVLVLAVGHRAEDDMFSELQKVRRGVGEVVIDVND